MSTTGNNDAAAVAAAEPVSGDAAHTDLVTRLVAEAYSEFNRAVRQPATLPPAPAESPGVPGLPDISVVDAPAVVPPVHPNAQPAAPKLEKPPEKTPTGAHAPESGDAYAFGEPRCNGSYRPQGNRPDTKTANNSSLLGLPGAESVATPEYYFLRGGNVSGKSPAACQSYPKNAVPVPKFDVEGVRRDFPALHQLVNGQPLIWLDNAATTHKPQPVIDATSQFYSRDNSNIHRAAHTLATRSTELFEAGREKVRKFLGAADAKEIVFVRGTTEAINLVAQSYGRKNIGAGDEIIVSELEHHANIVPWQLLAGQVGATLRVIPINDRGELRLEEFVKLLGPKTKFISVAHVSNSLGTINPVEQIIALAHARGVPVLVDGAQSTPHLPVNVAALDADFYVFSGHKVFAPTGVGALYGKAPLLEAMPPWQGGGHMIKDVRFEKTIYQNAPEKFEAGTPDIAGVVGLGAAIDYLFKVGIPAIAAYEHALLEYAAPLLATVPGLRPIGTAATKASVLAFVIPGVSNESIARHLDKHGIAVRAGHHCAQPAIRHFGLESSVRPSLAFYNTREEVDALVRTLRSLKPK
jgi:SufS family cysteine desulfurase